MIYYKVLNEDGSACHGGKGKWHLPVPPDPGRWMPKIKVIDPCNAGYHLCRRRDLLFWLCPVIWEAEGDGDFMECENKVVFQTARLIRRLDTWNEVSARLFACDCADHVVHFPDDVRCAEAIKVARLYAAGKATVEELAAAREAAWAASEAAAAWSPAWSPAWAAARAAEHECQTERLFFYLGETP